MNDQEFLAKKIVHCFSLFEVKYREQCYKKIEEYPEESMDVKVDMVLHNVYLLRMLVDYGFKQYMLKKLSSALENDIKLENIKNLIVLLIDEIEENPSSILNVLEGSSKSRTKIDIDFLRGNIKKVLEFRGQKNMSNFFLTSTNEDLTFFNDILAHAEKDTSLYRSVEDHIKERKSGMLFSRYFELKEISFILLNNINNYIKASLMFNLERMAEPSNSPMLFIYMIPEFYENHIKINKLLHNSLKDLIDVSTDYKENIFSFQAIHFMSILMALLFEKLTHSEKVKLLNGLYEYQITKEDIQRIDLNFDIFGESMLYNNLPLPQNLTSSKPYLGSLGRLLYENNLHEFSLIIDEYLYENDQSPLNKILHLDNIATAYRDLEKNDLAINNYEKASSYYKQNGMKYRYLIALKNNAFCFHQKGDQDTAIAILKEIENSLTDLTQEEKASVYYNLAIRYRYMYIFEEEERCLNEAFMIFKEDHPRCLEIIQRLTEIGEYFDVIKVKLDNDALKKLQIKRVYEFEKGKIIFHQNHLNTQLTDYYINRAYKEYPKDRDYWIFKSINIVLKGNWLELISTSEELLKLIPEDISGIFFKTLYYIEIKDFNKLSEEILNMYQISIIKPTPKAFFDEKILNFIYFFYLKCSKNDFFIFIDKLFILKKEITLEKNLGWQLLAIIAHKLGKSAEKEFSGYIFKKFVQYAPDKDSYFLLGGWYFRFKEYILAKKNYEMALKLAPNDLIIIDRLARNCLMLNEFDVSISYIEGIIKACNSSLKSSYQDLKRHIIMIRDSKIRFESFSNPEVGIVFNTAETQLKALKKYDDIEFGNILTELSKGVEIMLSKTVGIKLQAFVKKKFPKIPNKFIYGNRTNIKSLNRIVLNFLQDPKNNTLTLGNWKYICECVIKGSDTKNEAMQTIVDFLSQSDNLSSEKLRTILKLSKILLADRNRGSHNRLYSHEEVKVILELLTPLINELLVYLDKRL
jgi:tetratricopeptide (TPR) repeat protein